MSTSSSSAAASTARVLCLIEALHDDETVVQETTIQIDEDGVAEVPLALAAVLTLPVGKGETQPFTPATEEDAVAIASYKREAVATPQSSAHSAQGFYDAGPLVLLTIPHLAGEPMTAPDNQPLHFDDFGTVETGQKTALAMKEGLKGTLEEGQTVTIEAVLHSGGTLTSETTPSGTAVNLQNNLTCEAPTPLVPDRSEGEDANGEGADARDENFEGLTPYEKGQRTKALNAQKKAAEEAEAADEQAARESGQQAPQS